MPTIWYILRRYIFTRWKPMALAATAGLTLAGLNLVSLELFATIPYLIMRRFTEGPMVAAPKTAGGGALSQLDINNLVATVGGLADQFSQQYGLMVSLSVIAVLYLLSVILTRGIQLAADYSIMVAKNQAALKTGTRRRHGKD